MDDVERNSLLEHDQTIIIMTKGKLGYKVSDEE